MNMLKNPLAYIEARLQALIEVHAARLIPAGGSSSDLAFRLVEALRAGVEYTPGGEALAPNVFTLRADPQTAARLDAPGQLDGLLTILREASQGSGLCFEAPLELRVQPVAGYPPGAMQVFAEVAAPGLTETASMELAAPDAAAGAPPEACLIVDGTRRHPLDAPVVNIGRLAENHLVIADARVSRRHAQLRLIRGRYVIFDLGSSGGTWVNGERVHQHTLSTGDVISLAGVPLLYRQAGGQVAETQDFIPPP
jgi:hypothetical protein